MSNFNPRAPRGARQRVALVGREGVEISIHALREERDLFAAGAWKRKLDISIHALREERDRVAFMAPAQPYLFQSTRSARSAT